MLEAHETLIRKRAYEIWELEGRPDGRQAAHWEQAAYELEMQVHAKPTVADIPPEKPAKRKPASKVTPIGASPKARKARQPSA